MVLKKDSRKFGLNICVLEYIGVSPRILLIVIPHRPYFYATASIVIGFVR